MITRLPIVGVMGSGTEADAARAARLGAWLAGRGVHLLTGGGQGTMAAVSEAFSRVEARRGLVIGILPAQREAANQAKPGYPNQWVEIPIRTHLPLSGRKGHRVESRNHINVLTPDAIVALPGGAGTASEVKLALHYGLGGRTLAYIAGPADIPGLPPEIAWSDDFGEVTAFVSRILGG